MGGGSVDKVSGANKKGQNKRLIWAKNCGFYLGSLLGTLGILGGSRLAFEVRLTKTKGEKPERGEQTKGGSFQVTITRTIRGVRLEPSQNKKKENPKNRKSPPGGSVFVT